MANKIEKTVSERAEEKDQLKKDLGRSFDEAESIVIYGLPAAEDK